MVVDYRADDWNGVGGCVVGIDANAGDNYW